MRVYEQRELFFSILITITTQNWKWSNNNRSLTPTKYNVGFFSYPVNPVIKDFSHGLAKTMAKNNENKQIWKIYGFGRQRVMNFSIDQSTFCNYKIKNMSKIKFNKPLLCFKIVLKSCDTKTAHSSSRQTWNGALSRAVGARQSQDRAVAPRDQHHTRLYHQQCGVCIACNDRDHRQLQPIFLSSLERSHRTTAPLIDSTTIILSTFLCIY